MTTLQLIDNTIPQLQIHDTLAKALQLMHDFRLTHLPVVSQNQFLGIISEEDLLDEANEYGALVVLQMERTRFAISEINSIVESDGAIILHLNITPVPSSDLLEVTLQINKKEIATIIATFERYEYSVSYYSGEELFENDISSNYQNLMNYLDI